MSNKLQAEREWTQAELCELLPPDVMWQDNLTPELLRYVLSRASLSSSQQVMNCRPECSGTYWAMEINAAREKALESAASICDGVNNHDNPMTASDCADAIRSLKSSPSQPSSVAMTDGPVAWWNGIRKGDPHDGTHPSFAEAEDTWHDIPLYSHPNPVNLQSSRKGASTGTEPVYYRYRHSEGENWHYGPAPQSWWECQGLAPIASLSSPQEASKPQDERIERNPYQNGVANENWRRGFNGEQLIAAKGSAAETWYKEGAAARLASQPSAASGRELPPTKKEWVPDLNFAADGWANVAYNGLQHLRNVRDGIGSLEAAIENMEKCCADAQVTWKQAQAAALTGAAPADANVGELLLALQALRDYGVLSDYCGQSDDARTAKRNARRLLDEDRWKTAERMLLGIAPEPSAPADKERLDFVIEQRATWYPGYYDGKWQEDIKLGTLCYGVGSKNRVEAEGATMREAIDAAMESMRSEDGKGGKL